MAGWVDRLAAEYSYMRWVGFGAKLSMGRQSFACNAEREVDMKINWVGRLPERPKGLQQSILLCINRARIPGDVGRRMRQMENKINIK